MKDIRINCTIDSETLLELDMQATKKGMSRSEYIRFMVIGRRDISKIDHKK